MDAKDVEYEKLRLFNRTVLFTDLRLNKDTIPDGVYVYEIREDYEGNLRIREGAAPLCNYWGTVLSRKPIKIMKGCERHMRMDDCNFLDEIISLADWLGETDA